MPTSTLLALVVGGMFVASAAGLALGWTGTDTRRRNLLVAVAVAAVAFQVFHFAEHLIQVAAWVANSTGKPYLTPWAASAGDGLVGWCVIGEPAVAGAATSLRATCGIELLHLFGNSIFFFGIIAVTRRLRYADATTAAALTVQGFHVVEHVLLTASLVFFGKAVGFSTYFGLVEPSAFTVATRVWFHFGINLIATIFAILSIRNGRRYRHITWDDRTGALSIPAWV